MGQASSIMMSSIDVCNHAAFTLNIRSAPKTAIKGKEIRNQSEFIY